jgi:hypothetical protein
MEPIQGGSQVIPVPIIDQVDMLWDGTVQVCVRELQPSFHWPFLDYRMIDNDPTRLEPAE